MIDEKNFQSKAFCFRNNIAKAQLLPNVGIDNFLPAKITQRILELVPNAEDKNFATYQVEKKFLSVFSHCEIFVISDISYHGLTNLIRCPYGKTRRQINVYYYTNGQNDQSSDILGHWAIHKMRRSNLKGINRPVLINSRNLMPKFLSERSRNKG